MLLGTLKVRESTVNASYTEMLWGFESLPKSTDHLTKTAMPEVVRNVDSRSKKVMHGAGDNTNVRRCDNCVAEVEEDTNYAEVAQW